MTETPTEPITSFFKKYPTKRLSHALLLFVLVSTMPAWVAGKKVLFFCEFPEPVRTIGEIMAKRHIYIIRHGQREADDGPDALGPSLTLLGWKQAHQAARRLTALKIDVIHTSSLRRAMETAQIIAVEHPNIPIRSSRLLWECIPYVPEYVLRWYKAHPEMKDIHIPPEIIPWLNLWPEDMKLESLESDFEQARTAWDKYFVPMQGKDRNEVIVCHGNIMRYFVMRALQVPPEAWVNTDIYNCAFSEILVESNGHVMLLSHNDSGHLPPEIKTFV